MKKLTIVLALLLGGSTAFAQATRLVLFEEFTQASCGPCASQNPAFNTLLSGNTTKAISIKYQTSWPGVDPMNAANPTDVATRVSYYGVNGVPWTAMDGVAATGSAYAGAPANVTQTAIDTRYAVASPLAVSVTHQLTSGYDSILIAVSVSNPGTSSVTSGSTGSLKLHTVIVEEEINYPTAPGSNGETDFYSVMRKMLPNASGTSLADTWAAGASQTFTFAVPLPSYIANLGEVAVVAFVQDNSSKDVKNAAYSAPQAVSGLADAGVNALNASTNGLCDANVTPSVVIENAGSIAITSATVGYSINGGTPVTQSWTGNLASGQTATVTFPQATLSGGTNVLVATVSNPNGSGDYNGMNNMSSPTNIAVLSSTPQASPKTEDMEGAAIGAIPADMIMQYNTATAPRLYVVDKSVAGTAYELGGWGQSAKSLRYDYYAIAPGAVMSVTTQKINISTLTAPKLFFTHAYASYAGEADGLKVFASTDCGTTWTNIFDKSGASLATSGNQTARFYPQASQWVTNQISLAQFASSNELVLKFEGTSAYGNSLYVDNIWVSNNALGVDENTTASLVAFPNPASTTANLDLTLTQDASVAVSLFNVAGQQIMNIPADVMAAGQHNVEIPVAALPNGLYTAQVSIDGAVQTVRISVAH